MSNRMVFMLIVSIVGSGVLVATQFSGMLRGEIFSLVFGLFFTLVLGFSAATLLIYAQLSGRRD